MLIGFDLPTVKCFAQLSLYQVIGEISAQNATLRDAIGDPLVRSEKRRTQCIFVQRESRWTTTARRGFP